MDALDTVIGNDEFARRPARPRRQEPLDRALSKLAAELATSPRQVLQKLTDAALDLCAAHSAGVSLLEEGAERSFFRWHAVSGKWAPLLWTTLPREFSPCGTVLDRKATQLMIDPERHFTPLAQVPPKVHEALLVPFEVAGQLVGTVWVISHDHERRFDSEDRRIVSSLAAFASKAYERLSSMSADDVIHLARLAAARPTKGAPRAVVQKRILVVDDNVDAGKALAALLRTMGHEVFLAEDGAAALALLPKARPEIALLDLAMPGMSGYELARQMRAQAGAAVRIVALSGFALEADRARAFEAGFDLHLVKPVDPAFLKSLLG